MMKKKNQKVNNEEVKQGFERLVGSIEERINELEEKENHWKELEATMAEHAVQAAEKITLNIGMSSLANHLSLFSHPNT